MAVVVARFGAHVNLVANNRSMELVVGSILETCAAEARVLLRRVVVYASASFNEGSANVVFVLEALVKIRTDQYAIPLESVRANTFVVFAVKVDTISVAMAVGLIGIAWEKSPLTAAKRWRACGLVGEGVEKREGD